MNYAELGRRIRSAREKASLSQDVVAQHLGLPRSAVSLIESGKRKVDSLELQKFSRLVGKSVLFFLNEESESVEANGYVEMAFEAYSLGKISLSKLAELLEIPLEEAKTQLQARNIPLDLGVSSELELLSDIKNA